MADVAVIESNGVEGVPGEFTAVARQVYRDDPMWIPESDEVIAHAFSAANPWFTQGDACCFCVGLKARAVAFFQPDNLVDDQQVAFFGYWETDDSLELNSRLFECVVDWSQARGARMLYGPINFTTYGNYRLRVAAESGAVTFPGEPYNPAYYPDLLRSLGFSEHQAYTTQVGTVEEVGRMLARKEDTFEQVLEHGYRLEPIRSAMWKAALPELHGLVDSIFGNNFAYTPLSYAAFERACGDSFIAKACPRTSVMMYGPEDDIAGFLLAYPNYGPLAVKGAGDQRVAADALSFGEHQGLLPALGPVGGILKTVGVNPVHRRKGVMDALTVSVFSSGRSYYDYWLGALIRSDNPSRRFGDGIVSRERWYVLYSKVI